MNSEAKIKSVTPDDKELVRKMLVTEWGSSRVVSRGRLYDADCLPGYIATVEGQPAGLITFHTDGGACEIVTLHSIRQNIGIGSSMIDVIRRAAIEAGCRRLWLITTNDNKHALRFYQRRGFVIKAIHVDAIAESRRLKPEIPQTGYDHIPIRDEIELEILLRVTRSIPYR
jgi:ribosomal protein S18 acetylase RimI-like enzyme